LELMVGTDAAAPQALKVLFPLPWEAQAAAHAKARAEVTAESEIAIATRKGGSSGAGASGAAAGRLSVDKAPPAGEATSPPPPPAPPPASSSSSSSFRMTSRFKSSAASAVGLGVGSVLRRKATAHGAAPAATAARSTSDEQPASSPLAPLVGDTWDVAWQCKPSATGIAEGAVLVQPWATLFPCLHLYLGYA
jgi:hypothetical protein